VISPGRSARKVADGVEIMDRFVEVDLIVISRVLLLELIAFGEAGCFGAANAAELLEYCARLLADWVHSLSL
jgi:hypothetical protein